MKKIVLGLLLFVLFIPEGALALNEVNVYFFHRSTCNICSQEKIYLQALQKRYPNMRIYTYEVSEENNQALMEQAKELYQVKGTGVPFTVIGDSAYLGFSQGKKAIMQRKVYEYSTQKYTNKLGKILGTTYRTDLTGTVEEYKDNADYKIEETSGKTSSPSKATNPSLKKYQASFILGGIGLVLVIIAGVLYSREKRGIS